MLNSLRVISDEAYGWIKSNRPFFQKNSSQKIRFEYLQYKLFSQKDNDEEICRILLCEIFDVKQEYLNSNLLNVKLNDTSLLNHEKMDLLALSSVVENKLHKQLMQELIDNSLLVDLIYGRIPLDVLASREMMYTITHLIMYASVFGKETILLSDIASLPEINYFFDLAILLSISQSDMDVFFELLLCVVLLRIENKLNPMTASIVKELLKTLPRKNGALQAFASPNYKTWNFDDVYHTTLVGGMLYHVINNRRDNLQESKPEVIAIEPKIAISLLMNLDEIIIDDMIKH